MAKVENGKLTYFASLKAEKEVKQFRKAEFKKQVGSNYRPKTIAKTVAI